MAQTANPHEARRRTLKARRIARAVNRLFRDSKTPIPERFSRGEEAKIIYVRSLTDDDFFRLIEIAYRWYAPTVTPTKPKDQRTRREVIRWFSRRAGN